MTCPHTQRGAALMEVLVAMLIVAFGVLGFVGLQARTAVTNLEAYQRTQALALLGDMVQRINLNRAAAADYVGNDFGATDPGACDGPTLAQRDLCEWSRLIRGAAETDSGNPVGAVIAGRGCIADLGGNQYLVSIVWQGIQPTGPTPLACGNGAYPDDNLRRGVSVNVRIGSLS